MRIVPLVVNEHEAAFRAEAVSRLKDYFDHCMRNQGGEGYPPFDWRNPPRGKRTARVSFPLTSAAIHLPLHKSCRCCPRGRHGGGPRLRRAGSHGEQTLPEDLPLATVDADKFKQVVLNLCRNAVEALPDGRTLTVRAHNSDARVMLELTDTGIGIPVDVNIFEPFFTMKREGAGLGLAIVRQIIEAHGGTLTYTSKQGEGTTFTLTFSLTAPREDR